MGKEKRTDQQIGRLCGDLAVLLHSGISLSDGMFLLAREEAGEMAHQLLGFGQRLDAGASLGDVLEESGSFPAEAVGMVRVGETTGRLEEALKALEEWYEERQRMVRGLKNALAYPSVILLLMLGVMGVLLVKVLPMFDAVYASLGSRLTGFGAGLLELGQWLGKLLPVLLAALAALVAAVAVCALCPAVRDGVIRAGKEKFGDRGILRRFHNARFARAMAMGLASGLMLEESVDLAKLLLGDTPGAVRRCQSCVDALARGESLDAALGQARLLDPAACRMLAVGLRGGNADAVMETLAGRMMAEAEETLEQAVSRIEPAMVLATSVLVGIVLLTVMLPLMNVMASMG